MVLKKVRKMKRHFAELCECDGNGSKTAPKLVNFAEACTEKCERRPGTVLVGSVWVKKYTKINIEKMKSGKS